MITNQEVLVELYRANTQLEQITWLLFGMLAVFVFNLLIRLYELWKVRGNAVFRQTMENYYNAGEFGVVVTGCETKIKIHTHDGWAYWWKGKAHIKLGEYQEARDTFTHLCLLEPGWQSSVNSYLAFLDALENPNSASTFEKYDSSPDMISPSQDL